MVIQSNMCFIPLNALAYLDFESNVLMYNITCIKTH